MDRPSSRLKVVETTLRKSARYKGCQDMPTHSQVEMRLTLIHVIRNLWMYDGAIERVDNAQPLLDGPRQLIRPDVMHSPRDIGLELELVDHVAEIMVVLVLQVGDEVLHVHVVRLERSSVAEVQVADDLRKVPSDKQFDCLEQAAATDLVDPDSTLNLTALGVLLGNLFGPALLDALPSSMQSDHKPLTSA